MNKKAELEAWEKVRNYPWSWRSMWVIAMFDLPTDTPAMRRDYTRFRKELLKDGFVMMQYSVYIRHCASLENARIHEDRMSLRIPPEGEVRFLTITDKQYERIRVFYGKKRKATPPSPVQLELF